MSEYDVFANPERCRQPNVPYVVVIQSDHFVGAKTTVVVPLLRIAQPKVTTAGNPQFLVNNELVTLEPFQVAFIPTRLLKEKIATLEPQRHLIIRAMDALMSGL